VEAESIRCWQRTSASSVRLGEPFALVLTCAVVDNDTTTVIVDQSRLEPSVVQFAPFEVVSGVRGTDLRSDNRRFFQYQYTLRLLNGDLFGKDATIPASQINYKIQTRTGRGDAVTGRDHIYLLPPVSVRVLSLVQEGATDIRDTPAWTFGDIDAQRFRARILMVVAGTLFAVGGVVLLLTLIRLARRVRKPATGSERLTSDRTILKGVGRELADVRRQAQLAGWTYELVARCLAALRIAGTVALGRHVSQVRAASGEDAHDGQVAVRAGFLGRKKLLASGSATANAIATELPPTERPESMVNLHTALARFTAAGFGRDEAFDSAALDESAAAASAVLRRLTFERRWTIRQFKVLTARVAAAGNQAWSR
jgi:hypothetical protein